MQMARMTRAAVLALALRAAGAAWEGENESPLSWYEAGTHRLIAKEKAAFPSMRECMETARLVPLQRPGAYGVCHDRETFDALPDVAEPTREREPEQFRSYIVPDNIKVMEYAHDLCLKHGYGQEATPRVTRKDDPWREPCLALDKQWYARGDPEKLEGERREQDARDLDLVRRVVGAEGGK